MWNMNFVGVRDVISNLDVWFHAFPMGEKMHIWQMECMTLIWSIWRKRNRIIFLRESFDEEGCFELYHFDLAWWMKVEWRDQVLLVCDTIQCPRSIKVPKKPYKVQR